MYIKDLIKKELITNNSYFFMNFENFKNNYDKKEYKKLISNMELYIFINYLLYITYIGIIPVEQNKNELTNKMFKDLEKKKILKNNNNKNKE